MNKTAWLVTWVTFLGMAWLQPDHFPPWLSFHSEILAFASVVACFIAALSNADRKLINKINVGVPELALCFVALYVWIQFRVGTVLFSGDVVIFLLYMVGLVLSICAGRELGGERAFYLLSWVILSAGVCSTAIALFQSMRPYDDLVFINLLPGWRRPGANLGQANHVGTLVLWSLCSVVYLGVRKKISPELGFFFGALLLFGASMTESRTALIGVWVLAVWLIGVPSAWTRRQLKLIALLFVLSGTIFFMSWPRLLEAIHEGAWNSSEGGGTTINMQGGARFVVWPQLLNALLMRPLTGWGFSGVSHALNAVADQYSETFPFTYAHNLLLDLMIWFGIPFSIALVGLTCIWLWNRVAVARDTSGWYAVALLIPFGLHSALEFPFAYAYFLFPVGYLIGTLDSGGGGFWGLAVTRRFAVLILLGWTAFCFEVTREYLLAEEDYRVARAEALRVGKTPVEYSIPTLPVLTQLGGLNKAIRIVPSPHVNREELELLRMSALRFPSIAVQNRYAMSLALTGNLTEAKRQLKVIRSMHGARLSQAVNAQWAVIAKEKYPQLNEAIAP